PGTAGDPAAVRTQGDPDDPPMHSAEQDFLVPKIEHHELTLSATRYGKHPPVVVQGSAGRADIGRHTHRLRRPDVYDRCFSGGVDPNGQAVNAALPATQQAPVGRVKLDGPALADGQPGQGFSGGGIPEPNAVAACGREQTPVPTEVSAPGPLARSLMPVQGPALPAVGHFPEPGRRQRQVPAIAAEPPA